jgi:GT2 family glycosyltransferase
MTADAIVDVLMITHNRPQYTAMALERLLESSEVGTRVWVWHYGPEPETWTIVSSFAGHPRLHTAYRSPVNVGLREATNWFWTHARAGFVGKVDDDCLVDAGWASALVRAHRVVPKLGIAACWHFYEDDFVRDLAAEKIRKLEGGQQFMLNCWVQGSGYVMKRSVLEQLGPLRAGESFTGYCVRASLAGWINGWHLPLIHIEHMDDPRSPHTRFRSEDEFLRNRPLSAVVHEVRTLEEWKSRARWMARSIQAAPYDPLRYVGWRAKLRNGVTRLKRSAGWQEPWRLSN